MSKITNNGPVPVSLGWNTVTQWASLLEAVPQLEQITGVGVAQRRLAEILQQGDETAHLGNKLLTSSPHEINSVLANITSPEIQIWVGSQLNPIMQNTLERQLETLLARHPNASRLPSLAEIRAQAEELTPQEIVEGNRRLLTDPDILHNYREILEEGVTELLELLVRLYSEALRRPLLGFDRLFGQRLSQAFYECSDLLLYCSRVQGSDVRLIDFDLPKHRKILTVTHRIFPFFDKTKIRGMTFELATKIRKHLLLIAREIDPHIEADLQQTLPIQAGPQIHPKTATRTQVLGALLGAAGGDAWAAPFENMSADQIAEYHLDIEEFRSNNDKQPGAWTDDTVLTQATLEAILEKQSIVPRTIAGKFAQYENQLSQYGFGLAGKKAIKRLNRRGDWKLAGAQQSLGNGAAMRIAPVAIFGYRSLEALQRDVALAGQITHQNYDALTGALAVAFIIAKILRNECNTDEILQETRNFVGPGRVATALRNVDKLLKSSAKPLDAMKGLGTSGLVWESVAAAIYAFLASPDNFEQSILLTARAGGDTDTIASITGALSGAYNGIEAIPDSWKTKVEKADEILMRAEQLFNLIYSR